MKKFLLCILILLIGFGGYLLYDNVFKNSIPILEIQEEDVKIDELFIYGTHLNLHGTFSQDNNLDLVLYNGEFISIKINVSNGEFNVSDKINKGIYLDEIPRGSYYLFLRETETADDDKKEYKYYALTNNTEYKETVYYTFSNFNNKITIGNEDSYPTMIINVTENKDNDIYDIVIDPGHGGMDSGSNKNGYKESDLTMKIANKLKKSLENDGYSVKLTREDGQFTTNETFEEYGTHGRAVISHEVHAKFLLSIHMNSNRSTNVSGLEVYTADCINYDFAKELVKNITTKTGLGYSSNSINKIDNSIYTRNFTEAEILASAKEKESKKMKAYDITTKSNYYYMIRETGGIMTGAYVDGRNESILANPYVNSNVGTESYLLELGYLSNKNNLDNMLNKMDLYVEAITDSFKTLNITNE